MIYLILNMSVQTNALTELFKCRHCLNIYLQVVNESEERERLEQELESLALELDKKAELAKDRFVFKGLYTKFKKTLQMRTILPKRDCERNFRESAEEQFYSLKGCKG